MNQFLDRFFLLKKAPDPTWTRRKKIQYIIWRISILFFIALCMGLGLLVLAVGSYPKQILLEYLSCWQTFLLNVAPVILLTFFLYAVIGRAWISFLLSGGLCLGFSLGNFFKLTFRNDPLYFEDLLSLREAKNMVSGSQYSLFINGQILTAIVILLLGTLILFFLVRGSARGWKQRLCTALITIALAAGLTPLYLSEEVYDSVENYNTLNRWSTTEIYVSHGFLYPFLHSVSYYIETPPEGYTPQKAEEILSAYADADIPEDRKVNVISIMREAYADFSQYDIEGLDESCYDTYHTLEEESLTGDLVTNIFAGGTIRTEQNFLTGSYDYKNYRSNTNSYVWYLREQGYTVEGSHPFYEWFYNRKNVNGYLGFERYRFWENDFQYMTDTYYPEDSVLYPEVYNDFVANKETGKPYFSFSVTVQSHGPYETEYYDGETEYLTGNYSSACKNAMNNYLSKITDGDRALADLVDQLREDPDPVVLVVFSDHLPWMGDGNIFYDEMNIDMDPSTDEGFLRYYSTRYLIWANDAAKEVLGHDVTGEGPSISPCYLMNLVFDQLGWDGPAYMQAMGDIMDVLPVISTNDRYIVNGTLTDVIPAEQQQLYQNFLYIQQYWRTNFLYGK